MRAILRGLLLPVLLGGTLLTLIALLGAALLLYREAAAVHPWLGGLVAGLLAIAFTLAFLVPLVKVASLPRGLRPPQQTVGLRWDTYVRRYARRLCRNPILSAKYQRYGELERLAGRKGSDTAPTEHLEREIGAALTHLDERARQAIASHAAAVFASTAVSQSGRLDTLIVLAAQVRLVHQVAQIYVRRPPARELGRLYLNVGASAFVAGRIEDNQLMAVLSAPIGAAIAGLVPISGTDPIISLLMKSLLEGSANAFLTLRIGALSKAYCGLRPSIDRGLQARSASLEATGLLADTITHGAGRIASATRKLVLQGALRGTSRAARGVADLGTGVFGRLYDLAQRGAREVGQQARKPSPTWLRESLVFWESVASVFRSESQSAVLSQPRAEAARPQEATGLKHP